MYGLAEEQRGSRPESVEELGLVLLFGRGPVCPGMLQVVAGNLVFASQPTGSALVGRADRTIPLRTIVGISLDATGRLRVDHGGEALTVAGQELERIATRLQVLVSHAQVHPAATADDDGVLLDAIAQIQLGQSGLHVAGRLVVDRHRLRFAPASETESDHILDLDLGSLGPPELQGRPPVFRVSVAGRTLEISGGVASDAYSVVLAAQQGQEFGEDTGDLPRLERHEAALWRGPLRHPGTLVVGSHQLQFLPDSPGDGLLQVAPIAMAHGEIGRVLLSGWPRRRLYVVSNAGERHKLAVNEPDAMFRALVQRMHNGQTQRTQAQPLETDHTKAAIDTWSTVVPLEGEELLIGVPAIRVDTEADASPGVLLVTRRRVLFFPAGGPTGPARASQHRVTEITREHSADPLWRDSVRFRCGGGLHRYLPAADESFLTLFWDRCRAPSRIIPVEANSRSLQQLDGAARFLRLRQPNRVEHLASPGALVRMSDCWLLAMPRSLAPEVQPGARLTVELGRNDGVAQFDTEIVQIDPRIEADISLVLPEELRADHRLVAVTPPAVVRLFNQRRAFRVAVELNAVASRAMPVWPEGVDAVDGTDSTVSTEPDTASQIGLRLLDLSTGGCAVQASEALETGSQIDLMLPLPGRSVQTAARVLRVQNSTGGPHRYGLRFEGLRQMDEDSIHRHVLACQRAELAIPA